MANIPTPEQQGWEFALWYAFSKATKENDYADYLSIRRKTNFLPAEGAAWGANKQFTDLNRLTSFIRICAQKLSHKIKDPKKFLKGEGYFLEKYAGKKPFGGLYTNEEFTQLIQEWENRVNKIRNLYKQIPNNTLKLPPGGLKTLMVEFNIRNPPLVKTVEDAAQARIPLLLVSTGSGKNRRQAIAKGGNLPEKLINISGGESVRTIGKILWSPLYKVSQSEFVEASLKLARNKLSKNSNMEKIEDSILTNLYKLGLDSKTSSEIYSSISSAATVYLEIYPDHEGSPAWDAAIRSS